MRMTRKSKWTVTVPGNSEPQFHFYESLRVEVASRTVSYICGGHLAYQLFTENMCFCRLFQTSS